MERIDRSFVAFLRPFRIETLDKEPGSVYAVSADLRLRYVNPAWVDFARANGGGESLLERFGLGCYLPDGIFGEPRPHYEQEWRRILSSREAWSHDFECSSDADFCVYHQEVLPLGRGDGLLFVNTLRVQQPHGGERRDPRAPSLADYVDSHGLIAMCSYCRRVRRVASPTAWDWVPAWVERVPEHTSHSICPVCYERFIDPQFAPGR